MINQINVSVISKNNYKPVGSVIPIFFIGIYYLLLIAIAYWQQKPKTKFKKSIHSTFIYIKKYTLQTLQNLFNILI